MLTIKKNSSTKNLKEASHNDKKSGRGEMISLRASKKQKLLIDRAAELLGRTRSDFMLDTACREAEMVLLLDGRHFGLTPDAFRRFTAMLDKPPASNPKLRRLLQTKAPWGI